MQLIDRVPARLAGLLAVGADPGDDEDLKTNKATLILFSAIVAVLASIWVIVYFAVGRPLSASIPLFYQFASVAVVEPSTNSRRRQHSWPVRRWRELSTSWDGSTTDAGIGKQLKAIFAPLSIKIRPERFTSRCWQTSQ